MTIKTTYLMLSVFLCLTYSSIASNTPFSDNVNSLWLSGKKTDVLAIANQRLQSNPNDLAGLLLKMQYQMAFFDVLGFKDSIPKVLTVGESIHTPLFSAAFGNSRYGLAYIQQNVPAYSAQEISSESTKGNINGKPLEFLEILQYAETDGLIK